MKMAYYDAERERQEAVRAGERALESLRDAEHYLGGARLWGIVDLFGGSGLSGLVKHVRIGEASRCLERAKSDLRLFQKELRDVEAIQNLQIDIPTGWFSQRSRMRESRWRTPSLRLSGSLDPFGICTKNRKQLTAFS